jgi:AcrR family transcriptional regulator
MAKKKEKPVGAYHHGDLRKALIAAAVRSLSVHRVEELSLRALGRELGVSPRAPYRHFETKEKLLVAVAVEGFRMFGERLAKHAALAEPDAVARLRVVAEVYVLFAFDHPATFRVMYAPYATVSETAPELLRARADAHRASLDLIIEGQALGLLRAGDPMQLALVLWTSMHGLAVLLIEGQLGRFERPTEATKLASLVSGLVLDGLLAREQPRRVPTRK